MSVPTQNCVGTGPKRGSVQTRFRQKPCLHRVQYLMENSVFAYCIHTLRIGTDTVFFKNTESRYFRQKQGLYTLCTTLYFWKEVLVLNSNFHKEMRFFNSCYSMGCSLVPAEWFCKQLSGLCATPSSGAFSRNNELIGILCTRTFSF